MLHIEALQEQLSSPNSKVLNDTSSDEFTKYHSRWTYINHRTPAAIVLVATEHDLQQTVQWALSTSTPFVTRSGGHGEESTVESPGIIIDLSPFSDLTVNAKAQTASLTGSVLTGTVATALAEQGLFSALPNSHALGAIPYFLNGGNGLINSLVGFASDQIVSARLLTADGKFVDVNDNENADLLYAIRGAGQYFGIVTQLTIKIYPFSLLGNKDGEMWSSTFVFPQSAAPAVADTLESVIARSAEYHTAGSIITGAPPPNNQPALVVSLRLLGSNLEARAKEAFAPFHALKPIVTKEAPVKVNEIANALAPLNAHGDFKRIRIAGFSSFPKDNWLHVPALWNKLVEQAPDAKKTSFILAFDSRAPKRPDFESAVDMYDVQVWATNFVWYSEEKSRDVVDGIVEEVVETMRTGQAEGEKRDLPNSKKDGPVEYRHPGRERLERLRGSKMRWDPEGRFTRQLIDN